MSKYRYKLFADTIMLTHIIFIFIFIFGTIYIFFDENYTIPPTSLVSSALISRKVFGGCILTKIEKKFRFLFNPKHRYHRGVIANYSKKLFNLEVNPKLGYIGLLIGLFIVYTYSFIIILF